MRNLTQAESDFLGHIMMFGSAGYPVQKVRSSWQWVEFWGVKGPPITYKTKRDAVAAVERYIEILLDKNAGRVLFSTVAP